MGPNTAFVFLLAGCALVFIGIVQWLMIINANNNVNALSSKIFPAESCGNCPLLCAVASDCPNVFFSNQYTVNITCPAKRCIYDVQPITPIIIPVGRTTDLLCSNVALPFDVNCLVMSSVGDCNSIFSGCVGTYPCQFLR